MEINLEKHVGFQKLPQEEVELIQTQKTEKSRFKICIIITLCLAFIGKSVHHDSSSWNSGHSTPELTVYIDAFQEFWQWYFISTKKKF